MGRKIPGKKHRGVKDPYKQQEERYNKIKHKLNAKPKSTESQEVPRSLQRIANFNRKINNKSVTIKKKKKKGLKNKNLIDGSKFVDREKDLPGMTRPTKLVPLLQQQPKESYKKFLRRVDRVTNEVLKEAKFEKKYKVEVRRNEFGQVIGIEHQEKTDPLLSDKRKQELMEQSEKKKAARRERDKRQRSKKRKKNDDDDDEFSCYQDKFEFGEVVYEPPSLDTKKLTRKLNGNEVKPRSFLFMEKLGKKDENSPSNKLDKKAPRAKVSAGRRRILEEERLRVVEAYRSMKTSNQSLTYLPNT